VNCFFDSERVLQATMGMAAQALDLQGRTGSFRRRICKVHWVLRGGAEPPRDAWLSTGGDFGRKMR